ncbi:MAG: hypothetical protein RLY72_1543 [Planctomycetota bacterium]
MTLPSSPHIVVRATAERIDEALSALLAAGPAASARFARQAETAKLALDRIWCLADEFGRYRMAVLAVPTLGRTTMLLATHARSSADALALGPAVAAAATGCADVSDIAQALVEPARAIDIETYEAGGLRRLATLEYLERTFARSGVPDQPTIPAGWTIEPAADTRALNAADPRALGESQRAQIAGVLDESYRQTRDCPGLAGMRRTLDVLDGHFGLGARPRFWLLARQDSVARAVCLFNATPDAASAELVYLGIAPAARGLGIARALLSTGLRACAQAGVATVSLAVDASNEPARKLYATSGFRTTSTRVALVRPLAGARA